VVIDHQEGFSIVKGYQPTIVCQTVEFDKAQASQGDTVIVRKKKYAIADIEPDGTGITTVRLHEEVQ
jgi:hypothetical protein